MGGLYERPDDGSSTHERLESQTEGVPGGGAEYEAWRQDLPEAERRFLDGLSSTLGYEEAARGGDDGYEPPKPGESDPEANRFERVPLPWFIKRRLMKILLRDVHHYLFDTTSSPRPGERFRVRDEIRRRFVAAGPGQYHLRHRRAEQVGEGRQGPQPARAPGGPGAIGPRLQAALCASQEKKGDWAINALKQGVTHYYQAYADDPKELGHGINAVALLQRAKADGVGLKKYPGPKDLAAGTLRTIQRKDSRKRTTAWDLAAAAEAS